MTRSPYITRSRCHPCPRLLFTLLSLSLPLQPLFHSLWCTIERSVCDVLTASPTCNNYESTTVLSKCHTRDFAYQTFPLFSMQHWKAGNRAWARGYTVHLRTHNAVFSCYYVRIAYKRIFANKRTPFCSPKHSLLGAFRIYLNFSHMQVSMANFLHHFLPRR